MPTRSHGGKVVPHTSHLCTRSLRAFFLTVPQHGQVCEEFHKTLQSGCRLEDRQLRTIERFWPLLGVLSIVAVRLLQVREAARWTPAGHQQRAGRCGCWPPP